MAQKVFQVATHGLQGHSVFILQCGRFKQNFEDVGSEIT